MQSKGSSHRLSNMANRSRIPALFISMFATFASIYVAGRLWQDAQNRVYLIKELDRITGQGQSAISVDDTLKIIACREQHKKLDALEMELAAAKQEGFVSKGLIETNGTYSKRRPLVVIGILTKFGRRKNRDAIRKAWMGSGAALKKIEDGKGIIVRFVIGRSPKRGDSQDKDIDRENRLTNDFLILDDHVEGSQGHPEKAKLFFAHAAEEWDAEFYAKVNDDVYVNIGTFKFDIQSSIEVRASFAPLGYLDEPILDPYQEHPYSCGGSTIDLIILHECDALGATLATHLDKPRLYMGCMKSGEVFSEQNHKWYEPEWWKFGDKKSYFRHASGEMYVISRALAKFISINRSILRTYAHDDVSAGSWFIGLDVKHVDEAKFCCSSWSTGAICAGV